MAASVDSGDGVEEDSACPIGSGVGLVGELVDGDECRESLEEEGEGGQLTHWEEGGPVQSRSNVVVGYRAQAVLVDTATGRKVWPRVEDSKIIMVGYEVEKGDRAHALTKLAAAAAHCTTRYFYDCPKDKFKIAEDMSHISRENWGEGWDIGGF